LILKHLTLAILATIFYRYPAGCAGLRDVQKHPKMGEIAAKYADFIILITDDPRTEDVNQIIEQIAEGCLKGGA
jgi:UDP-N-acetylmuramoyl-L-alanyl-D-glutamate--2,6-diaminopimelate ligase